MASVEQHVCQGMFHLEQAVLAVLSGLNSGETMNAVELVNATGAPYKVVFGTLGISEHKGGSSFTSRAAESADGG